MILKVKDFIRIMEQLAPLKLKEEYDNVGLMIGSEDSEIKSILVALDCTLKVIEEAKKKDCNLIFTHHPLLYRKPSTVTDETLQGRKIIELIRADINLYSSHTNLDSVQGGINDLITQLLGFNKWDIIECKETGIDSSRKNGIGRIVELQDSILLEELCDNVKKALGTNSIRYSGIENMRIKRIAIINGSGQDYFNAAKLLKVDCIVTGDTTYHYVSDFSEENICIIDAGHFATEWPAFKLFADTLRNEIAKAGYENLVIVSDEVNDPYKVR